MKSAECHSIGVKANAFSHSLFQKKNEKKRKEKKGLKIIQLEIKMKKFESVKNIKQYLKNCNI